MMKLALTISVAQWSKAIPGEWREMLSPPPKQNVTKEEEQMEHTRSTRAP
jgi:hypothetical protein